MPNRSVVSYINSAMSSMENGSTSQAEDDVKHVISMTGVSPELLNLNYNLANHDVKRTKQNARLEL